MGTKKLHLLLLIVLSGVIFSCSKSTDVLNPEPNPNPDPKPVADTVIGGFAYMIIDTKLTKVDVENKSVVWQRQVNNLFNSAGSELNYDSGYLYHGNHTAITCYNSVSGDIVWSYSWLAYDDAYYNGRCAFNDSLVFFCSPTSAFAPAELYCLNKRTGKFKWNQQIDFIGWTAYQFYGIPVISNNKVVVLARDINGNRLLNCFNATDGSKLWNSGLNNQLIATLKINDNKVFSVGEDASCYDIENGNLLWQASLQFIKSSSYFGGFSCFESGKLVVVGKTAGDPCIIKTMDVNNGNIVSAQSLAAPFNNCMYGNNSLFVNISDSAFFKLRSYDVNTLNFRWEYAHFAYKSQIISDSNIIFSGISNSLSFLNLKGKLVKQIILDGGYFDRFIYIDKMNNKFYQQLY